MIRPPSRNGAAFSEASDGDLRNDQAARGRVSRALDIPEIWASVRQVHGRDVVRVSSPGDAGAADALWTTVTGLPVAVFTADCFGVVLHSDGAVGVAHAGWRGADAGVVANLREQMTRAGHEPRKAEIGPGIGSCCFEVGTEVAERFGGYTSETTWGTSSVDLAEAIEDQIDGVDVWAVDGCTRHDAAWFSHRRDATPQRLAAIGWLP